MKNLRRMPLVLTLTAILAVAAIGWLVPLSRDGQAAPAPSSDAAFKGKVLLVYTTNMMASFILEKAQIQRIGDRSWLVGKGADLDGGNVGPYKGRTVRVQMEHIVSIAEFDNLEDFKKNAFTAAGDGEATLVPAGTLAPASGQLQKGKKLIPPEKKR